MEYGFGKTVSLPYARAIERVTEELKKEGFGVLTTIDVRETMKQKLGVDVGEYVILGACNPPLAHQALMAEEEIGLLLPCNVIVYAKEGTTRIAAFDPMLMAHIIDTPPIRRLAGEVKSKLERVIAAI